MSNTPRSGLVMARTATGVIFLVVLAITLGTLLLRHRLGPLYWWGLGLPFVAYILIGLVTMREPPTPPTVPRV